MRGNNLTAKIVKESFLWLFVAMIFGLLQLWISLAYSWYTDSLIDIDIYFSRAILLFFSSGIVIRSSFDLWLLKDRNNDKVWYILFHVLIPMIMLVLVTTIYLAITISKIMTEQIKVSQLIILFYSILYAAYSRIHIGLAR